MKKSLKILFIEDKVGDLRLVERHLQNRGLAAECHRVASSEELQAALEKCKWDVVLSDHNVPTLDFEETLRLLQPELEELPLILVSGSVGEERAVELLKQGVWDFVLKDNLTRLVPAIEHGLREAADRRARRSAEAAQRESEARYRNLFEMESDAIFLVDCETKRFLDANPAALEMYGYSRDEILHLDVAAISAQPDQTLGAIENRQTKIPIRWHRKKDGTPFPVEIAGSFFNDQGRLIHAAAIRDITDRKQAEEALQQSEEFKRAVLDSVTSHIAVLDRNGVIVAVNERWKEFARLNPTGAGGPPKHVEVGANYLEVCRQSNGVTAESAMAAHDGIRAVIEGRLPTFTMEYPCDSPAEQRWFSMIVSPLGQPGEGVVVSHANITQRKLAEVKLQHEEAALRGILNATKESVFLFDTEGIILMANETAVHRYGKSQGEVIGHHFSELMPALVESRVARFQEVVRSRKPVEFEDERAGIQFHHSLYPIADASGNVSRVVCYSRDITERKHAEAALRESERKHRTLLESSRDAILTVDPATNKFTSGNPAALKMFGARSEAELIAHGPADYSPERQANGQLSSENAKQVDAAVMAKGSLFFEWLHRRLDGTQFFADVLLTRIEWNNQPAIMATVRDITERKEAELALQSEAERLVAILNAQREIAGADLEYSTLLQLVLECMSRLTGAEGASLEVAEENEMVYQAATGLAAPFVGLRLKILGSLSGLCLTSGTLMRSDDVETDSRVDRESCRRIGLRSMILVPLRYDEHTFGVLKLMSSRVAAFSADMEKNLRLMEEFLSATISRKRAETSLRQSEEQFRAMFEVASIGMVQTNPFTRRFVRVNQKFCEITGYSAEELLGMSVIELTHPDDRESERDLFRRVILGETPHYHIEKRYLRKDGTQAWVNVNMTAIRDVSGQPLRTMTTVEDITTRKLAEEERFRLFTAIEQSAESIVITDVKGTIVYVNPAFEKITGYSRVEAIENTPRMLKSGEHDAAFYKEMWGTITQGKVWRGRIINKRKDGTRFQEDATISPVRDAAGHTVNYVAIKLDVTREIELEAQFRQSQKLEAIGQLAGGVAHDFNNILAAILIQTQLSAMNQNVPPDVREGLEEIGAAAERAANLTRQLLLFSRRQVIQPRHLDLNEVTTNIAKMLQRMIGEDVSLQLNLHCMPLRTHADAGMLDQILMNLAVNARDAMPNGGKLIISTSEKNLDEALAGAYHDLAPGSYVCLTVADTGSGIPPEVLPRIFEPFFTTKGVGKGTGLGLATVFGIVKQHNGGIHVESEPGRGTRFEIVLPAAPVPATSDAADAQGKLRGGTETILLVEDDRAVRKMTRAAMEQAGYKVLEATSGVDAMQVWAKYSGPIHLLFTDIVMPEGINGRELAEHLRQRNPQLRIVFTSGYSAEIASRGLVLEAGQNFIQKPASPFQIMETIRKTLDA